MLLCRRRERGGDTGGKRGRVAGIPAKGSPGDLDREESTRAAAALREYKRRLGEAKGHQVLAVGAPPQRKG